MSSVLRTPKIDLLDYDLRLKLPVRPRQALLPLPGTTIDAVVEATNGFRFCVVFVFGCACPLPEFKGGAFGRISRHERSVDVRMIIRCNVRGIPDIVDNLFDGGDAYVCKSSYLVSRATVVVHNANLRALCARRVFSWLSA